MQREPVSHRGYLDLPTPRVEELLSSVAQPRRVTDGHRIVTRGHVGNDGLFHLVTGLARVIGVSFGGREFVLTYHRPGDWFGEISLLDDLPRTHDNLAVGDCELEFVARRDYLELARAHPEVEREMVQLTCRRLRMMFEYVEEVIAADLAARLAIRLLALARDHGETVDGATRIGIQLTQEVLAQILCSSRESIGRLFASWQREGWIAVKYGKISLLDLDALHRVASAA